MISQNVPNNISSDISKPTTASVSYEQPFLNLNGIDAYGQFITPIDLIEDWVITVSIKPEDLDGTGGRRILGCDTSLENRVFLRYLSGQFQFSFVGQTAVSLSVPNSEGANHILRVQKIGSTLRLSELISGLSNEVTVSSTSVGILTSVGRHLTNYFKGIIYGVNINGVAYKINKPTTTQQPSSPFNGNSVELINIVTSDWS